MTPTARKLTKVVQRQVVEEGRSLLVVLNKMDECAHAEAVEAAVLRVLEDVAVDVRGVQLMPLSALTGEGVERLMPAVYPDPSMLLDAVAAALRCHCMPLTRVRALTTDRAPIVLALLDRVSTFQVYDTWNFRVGTSKLNRWLERMVWVHPPPLALKPTVVRGPGRDRGRVTQGVPLRLK